MYIRSISPILSTILIIVITVAIAGIFYAFTSGMFSLLTSSSNNLVNQQFQITSFTISNVYCSNNIIYFNIYNNGNVPININNSVITFTDNNGNTISINGSNIICNNGNIIPSRSGGLCYILNNTCYYNDTNYIKSMNFVFNGISYSYDILNNKFNLLYALNFSNNSSSYLNNTTSQFPYLTLTLYNTQSISTPSPFQQQIAICNGTINIGPNFAYVNNVTLFNLINSNGSNVYFTTTYNSTPNIYSWYTGQLINGSTYCKIWWIKLDNGIPANSNVTIYMYIGNDSSNYYQQYYPYVGASPNVFPSRQYDNGRYVFIAYGYFNNTMDGWTGHIFSGSFSPRATPYGIEMVNDYRQGTYILPPNNWNIPLIPLIVEEAWYYIYYGNANVIALFGNTSQQFYVGAIRSTTSGYTPTSNLSTIAEVNYRIGRFYLKSAVTDQYLNYTSIPGSPMIPIYIYYYSYLIVNSTYAQAGLHIYSYHSDNASQIWVPLTLLNTYTVNKYEYIYGILNYNPFQYGTLQISAGTDSEYHSYQYVQWVVARAYPPNGVMPSIYIG